MKRCLILLVLASCSLQPEIKVEPDLEFSPGKAESTTSQPTDIEGDRNIAIPQTQTGWFNLSLTEVAGGSAALGGLLSWLWFSMRLAMIRKDTDFEEMARETERHIATLNAFKEITLAIIEKR